MPPIRLMLLIGIWTISAHTATASDYDHCSSIIQTGLREYRVKINSAAFADAMHDRYCDGKSVKKNFSASGSAMVPIEGIPAEFSNNFSNSSDKVSSFCKDYQRTTISRSNTTDYAEEISARALDSYDLCVGLAANGTKISHKFISGDQLRITIQASASGPVEIRRLNIRGMQCGGTVEGVDVDWNKERDRKIQNSTTIFCERMETTVRPGHSLYPEASLSADIRGVVYDLVWPRSTLAIPTGEQLALGLEKVKAELDRLSSSRMTFRLRSGPPSSVPGQSWASCEGDEALVSGSCIGNVDHVDQDRAVGGGQFAIGPYFLNANRTWPGTGPIKSVECRSAASPVRAFSVCMKIETK